MLPVSIDREQSVSATLRATVREVVQRLAAMHRPPCSPGEREAALWLAARMRGIDGVEVTLEDEPSWGTFPPTATGLGLLGLIAAALVLRDRRRLGSLLAVLGLAGIVDEAQNGPRIVRRLLRRRQSTVNVSARTGDTRAEHTLVVLAHHDAPQTGIIFDQTLQKRLYELMPERMDKAKTPFPQWWIGLAGPLCTLSGALLDRRRPVRAGLALGAFGTALVADVWRSETVTGANDNLSGVACLVGLAELLSQEPLDGLNVMLVSCGAEETLQDGIRAFMARHGEELSPEKTSFVNLDTVGSPHLVMLEGEGPIWMERDPGEWLRNELELIAERLGIPLERGFLARASTDSIIPARAGHAIATLVSITDWRSPANYHLPSDIPANLDYGAVAEATRLIAELMRELARGNSGENVGEQSTEVPS
jgi:hypothetical protein